MKITSPPKKSAAGRKSKSKPVVKTAANKKIQRVEQKATSAQTPQDSEFRYRRLFEAAQDGILVLDATPDSVVVIDPEGTIVFVNQQTEKLFGYSRNEILGKSVDFLIPERFRSRHSIHRVDYFAEPRARQMGAGLELFGLAKDGTEIPVDISLSPFQTREGPLVLAAIRDVTQRKQAEEELRYQAAVLENVSDAIIASDAQYRVTLWNPTAEALYGWKAEEVLGQDGLKITHTEWPEADAEAMRRAIARMNHWRGEATQTRKDGTRVAVEISVLVLHDANGQVTGYVSANRDITKRKQTEEALRKSERILREAESIGHTGSWEQDLITGEIFNTEENVRLFFGHDLSKGEKFEDYPPVVHPDDREYVLQRRAQLLQGGPGDIEYRVIWPDGSVHVIFGRATVVRNESGQPTRVNGTNVEVTERKRSEEALRESEDRYRALVEQNPDMIGVIEEQGLVYLNRSGVRLLGAERLEQVLGKNSADLVHPDDLPAIRERSRRAAEEHETNPLIPVRLIRLDGTIIEVETTSMPFVYQGKQATQFIARDITARKQVEEAMRTSEARYRGLFEDSPIALWEEDFSAVKQYLDALRNQGITDFSEYFASHPEAVSECIARIKILDINKATLKLFGANQKEDLLRSLGEISKGVPTPEFVDEFVKIASGKTRFDWQGQNKTLDGRLISVQAMWSAAPGNEDSLSRVNFSMIDVTERKQAEEALMHERNLIRTLIDIVPDIIFAKDMEGRFLLKNAADARRMGASSPEETIGKTDFDYYPHDLAAQYSADDEIVLRSGQSIVDRQEINVDAAGRSGWTSTTKVPLRDAHGEVIGLVGIGHDITERKQAEILQAAVFQIARAAVTTDSLDNLYVEIHHAISSVMPAENFYITLYDAERDFLTFPYVRDEVDEIYAEEIHPEKGLTAYVLRTGKSLLCTQAIHDELEQRGEIKLLGTPSSIWLGVPLQIRGQTIGVMVVQHYSDPKAYGEREQHMLEYVSAQVATAISRKQTEEKIQRQLGRLAALHDIDQFISASFNLRMTLEEILKHVQKELGVDAADVLLLNSTSLFLEYSASVGFRTHAIGKASVRLGQNHAGVVALKRELVQIPNLKDQPPESWLNTELAGEEFVWYCGVPLVVKGIVKGVLEAYHRSPLKPDHEWLDFLNIIAGQTAIAIDNALLFENLERSNVDLTLAYDATIEGWSHAMDLRDKETEGHTLRVTEMTIELAGLFGIKDNDLVNIRRGALLHDIGKMGVPDGILLKEGPLTDEEWVIMKKHPALALEMLSPIQYLKSAMDIPSCHHEKWDGTGYPRGLKGPEIPLPARIFAVVDVWDALTSDRPYRAAWSHEKAIEYIRSQSGKHFDPEIVTLCLGSGVFDRKKTNNG